MELKLLETTDSVAHAVLKRKEKKVGFLYMEMQDIKNNKGAALTLQVKSVEHLQTWLKKNEHTRNELEVQALDLRMSTLELSLKEADETVMQRKWWLGSEAKIEEGKEEGKGFKKPKDFKGESSQANDILEIAKKQHMNTDIKKAVFQGIVGADDYIQAFENCIRLNLKKEQEREIIKVLLHCCLSEKSGFNKFYALLAQRLAKYQP